VTGLPAIKLDAASQRELGMGVLAAQPAGSNARGQRQRASRQGLRAS
jgi:hypothetical protein